MERVRPSILQRRPLVSVSRTNVESAALEAHAEHARVARHAARLSQHEAAQLPTAEEEAARKRALWAEAQAQLEADAAMQNYQAVMQSGTEDLGKLEAAAEQVGHASESLAAANGKASDATDELAKTTQKASDEADKAAKTGTEAVTTIAQALAAAGITATIKEITSAVYDMTNAYSDAEKIIVNATGATGDALDGLGASALKAFSQNDDALSSVAG